MCKQLVRFGTLQLLDLVHFPVFKRQNLDTVFQRQSVSPSICTGVGEAHVQLGLLDRAIDNC